MEPVGESQVDTVSPVLIVSLSDTINQLGMKKDRKRPS